MTWRVEKRDGSRWFPSEVKLWEDTDEKEKVGVEDEGENDEERNWDEEENWDEDQWEEPRIRHAGHGAGHWKMECQDDG